MFRQDGMRSRKGHLTGRSTARHRCQGCIGIPAGSGAETHSEGGACIRPTRLSASNARTGASPSRTGVGFDGGHRQRRTLLLVNTDGGENRNRRFVGTANVVQDLPLPRRLLVTGSACAGMENQRALGDRERVGGPGAVQEWLCARATTADDQCSRARLAWD